MRVLTVAVALSMSACASLPAPEGRAPSSALETTAQTPLGRAVAPQVDAHPGKSGFLALGNPLDAFAARALLARAAQRSLDVQYYIWHGDTTGYLLFAALWEAAGRGVRVRLLIDDNNTKGLDPTLSALDAHPNIEVRLFNPFPHRSFRAADYVTDFSRTNRRMHNKSFTADNQATIVGGRNVGDEYYGAEGPVVFADLDVLGIGPIVSEVSRVFDLYWNSESAYPAAGLIGPAPAGAEASLREKFAVVSAEPAAQRYVRALRETALVEQLLKGALPMAWATARVVYDEPSKVLDRAAESELLLARLARDVGMPARQFDVVSPYFVPTEHGTAAFTTLAKQGVKVRILTNSLAATDVTAVHAGYAKRREDLLRAGVQLFELKPSAGAEAQERDQRGLSGSSGASLHAKTLAADRNRIFVGSFNMDPRSARLNTEMGVVIDSPPLAEQISNGFDTAVPRVAYEVTLTPGGDLEWIERTQAGEQRFDSEPGVGFARRLGVGFLSILPIEWML